MVVLKCQNSLIRLLPHDDTVHRGDDRDVRKGFSTVLNTNPSRTFPVFPSNSRTFTRCSRCSYIARQCTVAE